MRQNGDFQQQCISHDPQSSLHSDFSCVYMCTCVSMHDGRGMGLDCDTQCYTAHVCHKWTWGAAAEAAAFPDSQGSGNQ